MSPDTERLLTSWLADGARLAGRLTELPNADLSTASEQLGVLSELLSQEWTRRRGEDGRWRILSISSL